MQENKKQDDRIYLRLPSGTKQRLEDVIEKLNKTNPEANYTISSITRAAIVEKIEQLEKEVKQKNK